MAIEAISAEYSPPGDDVAIRQSAQSEDAEFQEVLSQTFVDSGKIDLDAIFEAAGQQYNLSTSLLKAVAKVESDFRPNVTSSAGAMGVMQLMPGTAKYLGVTDAYDPEQNIMGGAKYLRELLDRFGDVRLALAGYNSGPNNVTKYDGVPPFCENYVSKVLEYMGEGDITAGMVTYGGPPEAAKKPGSSFSFGEAFSQMLLIKIIEMQMNSSKDDKNKVY